MSFLDRLASRVLIGDGAMGTLLYEQGVDQCFEEVNITTPEKILHAHKSYVEAGADVLQTNTYAANRLKLEKYGLEKQVASINRAGVQLAKEAGGKQAFVLGTVGGIRRFQLEEWSLEEIECAFQEQMHELLSEGMDGLLLETFYDLEEAKMAVSVARKLTELPIVVNLSLGEIGVMNGGIAVSQAFNQLTALGANVVGLNCRTGPFHMLQSFETIPLQKDAFLSAYPNASLPDYRDGRFFYQSNADYFQDMGIKFIQQGVRLLGGCCGTTPEHIKAFAKVREITEPIKTKTIRPSVSFTRESIVVPRKDKPLPDIVKERKSVIVELDPPKKLSTKRFMQGAHALQEVGVDAITMADNSLASPRVDNLALGAMIKEQVGARPLVHVTCRDRNLIGLQSHLMGLHALGIDDVLAITGDPTKIGDFPGATSVYDVSSFQLISFLKQLNEGISFSGKELGQKANFSVGAAFNPNVRHLDKAVKRMEKKIESGADYFMTQPIYSIDQIESLANETKHIQEPIYIGIMPLTGTRNAEFLHNEVPGIKLTDDIRATMAACGEDKEASTEEGIKIAKSLIDAALQYFNGIYLITPFMRYEMTVELTKYIEAKKPVTQGVNK
ncbi:bifunctional homocysteine S-methyltransferase/methylenetetrahydrofolate reductase [Alkalihalobacillus sp. MEB130]|uniref:bifunctional homocysteine S-methyltransferase/methylenetetrahydrofolate reductase n=1 Tax=Alkalihalobacillus sp. MEB130 TaxID=2976704 RepID=UPI0028DE8545|nr:bifunctional homocysteine S-methyltransferase/methylenetetrahydrofolate reductase [Alkalihalobacillus sp. MEB130]MDT8860037.1 bifunctional homocysteine S-methyltransferase/methylenetetrahydrofolate reductase [Alkalihalobacillus sp. MEB130]